MKIYNSIKFKLLSFVLCSSLIPGVIITSIYYFHSRNTIKHQIIENLRAVAASRESHIQSLLKILEIRTIDFSADVFMRDKLETIVCGGDSGQDTVSALTEHLTSMSKQSFSHHLLASFFTDRRGRVVSSTNNKLIGRHVSDECISRRKTGKKYREARIGRPHYFHELGANCLCISATVFSKKRGKPLGIIVHCYSLAVLNEITNSRIGMGSSGEVYLVNKDKLMFSESRFVDNAILRQVVDTKPVRKMLDNGEEIAGIYSDYRGKPVVGVSKNIRKYGWALLAEIDKSEAFAPLNTLCSIVLIIAIVVGTSVATVGITYAVSTSKAINDVTVATEQLASGNLNFRAVVARHDEIGRLAGSFNAMAEALVREIAGHRMSEDARYRLIAILEATPDFVAIADIKGRVQYINSAGRKMVGISEGEDITNMAISYSHPEWARKTVIEEGIPAAIRHGVWAGETAILSRDGREIQVSQVIIAHKLPSGQIEFLSTIARDITGRKKMESELERHRQHLESLVDERAAELKTANERLHVEIIERKEAEEKLKALNESLEKRVEERTHALAVANEDLKSSVEKFRQITEHTDEVFWMTSLDSREMIYVSPAYEKIWGRTCKSLYEKPTDWLNAVHPQDRERVRVLFFGQARSGGFEEVFRIVRPDGAIRWIRERAFPVKNEQETVCRIAGIAEDITERTEADNVRVETNKILELFACKSTRKDYLKALLDLVLANSECSCAGIRVLDADRTTFCESYTGFPKELWMAQNWLDAGKEQCACTRIIAGKVEPQDRIVMTPFGSFVCNDTKKFLAGLLSDERARFRSVCITSGYGSAAVIPIRYRMETIGAIHLADKGEGKLPAKTMRFFESISPMIGEAVHRFNIEEELNQNYDIQSVINELLCLSLENISLDEILRHTLNLILSFPWLSLESMGCIFLVENGSNTLVMKASAGLADPIQKACAQVPFGTCLCGKAALSKTILFADGIDLRHDIIYEGISPHGHYCVPILSGDRKIHGVITLYLKAKHRHNAREEEFLGAVAKTLSGIIERKLVEDAYRKSEATVAVNLKRLQNILNETITALSLALEKRDPYTAGHQQRVAQLACSISREMGLAEEQIEGIRIAGTIHDIGKIYVPSEILSKPGKLTGIEFCLIKTHPEVGYEILKRIEFPWPIAQIVLQHHETMNGAGYPGGLSGDKILLDARILCVADVVEAIATHRPYRPALGMDKALEEIERNKGILYDPVVVDACTKLFNEKNFQFEQYKGNFAL